MCDKVRSDECFFVAAIAPDKLHEHNSDYLYRHMAFEEGDAWMESAYAVGSYLELLLYQTGNIFCIREDGPILSASYDVIELTTLFLPIPSDFVVIISFDIRWCAQNSSRDSR